MSSGIKCAGENLQLVESPKNHHMFAIFYLCSSPVNVGGEVNVMKSVCVAYQHARDDVSVTVDIEGCIGHDLEGIVVVGVGRHCRWGCVTFYLQEKHNTSITQRMLS